MKAIPYISFNGTCEEAVAFYQSIIGGKINSTKYNDLPADENMPISETWQDKIMHSALTFEDGNALYISDKPMGDSLLNAGNYFYKSVTQ